MFEAKLTDGVILKKIVESIKDLVTDVNIDTSPTGISLQAMDSSHVALVTLHLSMDGFETYRSDRPMTLGVSITNLAKVMKLATNDDTITLKAEEDPSYLTIVFENKRQERTTEFNLNLITLDSEHLGIPETDYTSVITLNATDFTKICRELYQLSETVTIETNKGYVKFAVEGEVGSGSVKIDANEADKDTVLQVEEPVTLSFALRYLNMFNKASMLSNNVSLMIASDTPLVVEYKIEGLGSIKFYLAPKISE